MNRRGFTLVELLVVLGILGILINIALPQYRDAKRRAVAASVIANVNTIRLAAFEAFAADGTYPRSARWGRIPPAFAPTLPGGFTFSQNGVDYRWRRWALPDGTPRNRRQTVLLGIEVRTSDRALLAAVTNLYRGELAFGRRNRATFVLD